MKAVLDTNVLVSGLLTAGGLCNRVLRLVADGALTPCVDDRILREYKAVLPRPEFGLDQEDVAGAIEMMRENAEFLTPPPLRAALPDLTDLPFLEVAAAAGAVLVTGNARHFPNHVRCGVEVLSARALLDRMSGAA